MTRRRYLVFAGIFCLVAGLPGILFAARKVAPGSPLDKYYFSAFFSTPIGNLRKTDIVVYGDSIVYRAPWRILYPFSDIVNLGVIGNTTQDLFNRQDQVATTKPRVLFVLAGINDLTSGSSVDELTQSYRKLANALAPYAGVLYLSSLIPSDLDSVRKAIPEVNTNIEAICKAIKNCRYVNLYAELEAGGKLRPSYSLDGVHLTWKGYYRFARVMAKYPF